MSSQGFFAHLVLYNCYIKYYKFNERLNLGVQNNQVLVLGSLLFVLLV